MCAAFAVRLRFSQTAKGKRQEGTGWGSGLASGWASGMCNSGVMSDRPLCEPPTWLGHCNLYYTKCFNDFNVCDGEEDSFVHVVLLSF